MSITRCFDKLDLNESDKSRARELADIYTRDGMPAIEAGRAAARDVLKEQIGSRSGIVTQIESSGGLAPKRSDGRDPFGEKAIADEQAPVTQDLTPIDISEYEQARTKGLDMSIGARRTRAEEMGYDTTQTWYHGTSDDIKAFDLDKTQQRDFGFAGKGVYLTSSPGVARSYANTAKGEAAKNIIPVHVSANNPFQISQERKNEIGQQGPAASEALQNRAIEDGFDSIEVITPNGEVLERVIFDPKKIRSVNAAFDPDRDTPNLLMSQEGPVTTEGEQVTEDQPEFYSGLLRSAQGLKQNKGQPEQMLATMKKMGGVTDAEIEATGLDEFLEGKKSVTKQQIIDHVAENMIEVETVTLGGDVQQTAVSEWMDNANAEVRENEDGDWIASYGDGDIGETFQTEEAATQALEAEAKDQIEGYEGVATTKYKQYSTPGGTNYREVLMKLPTERKTLELWRVLRADGDIYGDYASKEQAQTRADSIGGTVESAAKAQELDTGYRSPHYGELNIVTTARVSDRKGPNGEKILFVDEVQSDWGAEGRKKGYKRGEGEGAAVIEGLQSKYYDTKRQHEAARKELSDFQNETRDESRKDNLSLNSLMERHGKQHLHDNFTSLGEDLSKLQREIESERTSARQRVPDMPFKNNAWAELTIKKLLRMAADGGYDSIAWTPGEVQADRYDLSKHLDSVTYQKRGDVYNISAIGKDSEAVWNNQSATIEMVEDNLGKEIAQKVSNEEGNKSGKFRFLTGLDLKGGGAGMKSFYDRTLPNLFKKVARKMDKASQVEILGTDIDFDAGRESKSEFIGKDFTAEEMEVHYKNSLGADTSSYVTQSLGSITDQMREGKSFKDAMNLEGNRETAEYLGMEVEKVLVSQRKKAHKLAVTPKAKAKIKQGQALFAIKAEPTVKGMQSKAVQAAVAPTLKKLGQDIKIVQSIAELPFSVPHGTTPAGLYHQGQVYLVSDNIKDPKHARLTAAHEIVGHRGILEGNTSEQWMKIREGITELVAKKDKVAVSIMSEVKDRYDGESQEVIDKEFIAIAAERRVKQGPVARLLKEMRVLVRRALKAMGFTQPFSSTEIDLILSNAEKYLKKESKPDQEIIGEPALAAKEAQAEYPLADEWWGDADYLARGGRIVEMTPDEYLKQVKPLDPKSEDVVENVQDLVDHVNEGRSLDPLVIYADGKEDGRHRALMAKKLGMATVPVIDFRADLGKLASQEKAEMAQAKAKGLDMSKEARMARAEEMGFDTDQVYYHGTDAYIDAFTRGGGGELGKGVYVTKDPDVAKSYGGNVRAVFVRGYMRPITKQKWLDSRSFQMTKNQLSDRNKKKGEWKREWVDNAEDWIESTIKKYGGSGIYEKNPTYPAMDQGVVYDPANIRDVEAAFDPDQKESTDLLASQEAPPPGDIPPGGEGELAKQKRSEQAKARYQESKKIQDKDELLTVIAKKKGISRVAALAANIEEIDIKRKAGLLSVFPKTGGMTFGQMAESLGQTNEGWFDGPYTENALVDMVHASLVGEEKYNYAGTDLQGERIAQERMEQALIDENEEAIEAALEYKDHEVSPANHKAVIEISYKAHAEGVPLDIIHGITNSNPDSAVEIVRQIQEAIDYVRTQIDQARGLSQPRRDTQGSTSLYTEEGSADVYDETQAITKQTDLLNPYAGMQGPRGVIDDYTGVSGESPRVQRALFGPDIPEGGGIIQPPQLEKPRLYFNKPEQTTVEKIIQKIQNKLLPVVLTQREIKKKLGKEIPEHLDVNLAEEAFHGKTKEDIDKITKDYVQPLADGMAKHNVKVDELDEYLRAKHAKERNRQIAKINPRMQDGGSGMTNKVAANILRKVKESGRDKALIELSEHVYGMQEQKRQLMRAGLQEDEITDKWISVYSDYVPLKGYAYDDPAKGNRVGKGFSVSGDESQRATGKEGKPESPTLNTIKDLAAVTVRFRKNEVGNVLLDLVEEYPNPKYWEIFTDESPDVGRKIIKNRLGETIMEGAINMGALKQDYFTTKRDGKTHYIKLHDDQLMRAMTNMGPEPLGTVLQTMANVTRFLSAMSTTYSPEFMISNFSRDIQTAVVNMLAEQDLTQGRAAGTKIAKKMVKGTPSAMKAIHATLTGKELTGKSTEWQEYYEMFREDGAQTGWFDQKEVDKLGADLESMVQMAQGGFAGNTKKFAKGVISMVENANTAVENAVRLSAYRNAIEAGVSRKKAASLAKNLTVNFNRKGEIGAVLNSLYIFANASIQGSATFLRAMGTMKTDEQGKKSLNAAQKFAAGVVGASVLLAMLNREMAGDADDGENYYDKVENHIRERSIVIMKSIFGGPPGEFYTIPLPYGYNSLHVLGDVVEQLINSDYRSKEELATHMTMAILGSFFPLGLETSKEASKAAIKTITPTVLSPFVQLAVNENFYGSNIYKENFPFGTQRPDSALVRRSTKEHWIMISKFLNNTVGGGTDYQEGMIDISPDSLNHLFSFMTGGAGQFASRVTNFATKTAMGEDVPRHQIPFARKISGEVKPYQDVSRFYDRANEIKQISDEHKSLKGKERLEFKKEHRARLRLVSNVKSTEKRLRGLRRLERRISEGNRDDKIEAAEKVQDKIASAVSRFNREYNETAR